MCAIKSDQTAADRDCREKNRLELLFHSAKCTVRISKYATKLLVCYLSEMFLTNSFRSVSACSINISMLFVVYPTEHGRSHDISVDEARIRSI